MKGCVDFMERTQEYWENRPEVYQMQYSDYVKEYEESMTIAKRKEKNGNLDPHSPNYISMTDEEIALHERDWKAFSRQRGFSEYDIAEYARWHKLSGQTDKLEFAFNDPWRRTLPNWESQLYVKHIENAISAGIEISSEIIDDYKRIKKELEKPIRLVEPQSDLAETPDYDNDDTWVDDWEDIKPKSI